MWEAERSSLQRELCWRSPARVDSHPSLRERQRWGRELGHLLPLPPPQQPPRSRGGGGSARNRTRCKLLGYPFARLTPPTQVFPFPQTASPAASKDGGSKPRHAVKGGLIQRVRRGPLRPGRALGPPGILTFPLCLLAATPGTRADWAAVRNNYRVIRWRV